ncbi:MAG: lysophospholipid acyltransferase family protein [Luteimonas sp.]
MIASLRACLKAIALALLVLAILPVQWLLLPFDALASRSARLWHRALCGVLGISVEIVGRPQQHAQTAYVGNHLSYLDIPLLGSVLRGSFVAKREMRQWPVLGTMATLQHTVFISRAPRHAGRTSDQMETALAAGRNLIIFPEGTSSDGSLVLPFKASTFAVLLPRMADGLQVQPFTVDLLAVDGHDVSDRSARDRYAYYRDMVLGPHLWAFLHARGARLRLSFHPPLDPQHCVDRKQLATRAHEAVVSALPSVLTANAA